MITFLGTVVFAVVALICVAVPLAALVGCVLLACAGVWWGAVLCGLAFPFGIALIVWMIEH